MKTERIVKIGVIFIIIFGSFMSCEDNRGVFVDCSECYSVEPDSGDLIIYLTLENPNLKVPLTIYKGQIDNNQIEYVVTAQSSPFYVFVDLNEYYSVKAEYASGNRTIYAVDGDKIKSKFVTETCDYDCWVITGGIINVELKDF